VSLSVLRPHKDNSSVITTSVGHFTESCAGISIHTLNTAGHVVCFHGDVGSLIAVSNSEFILMLFDDMCERCPYNKCRTCLSVCLCTFYITDALERIFIKFVTGGLHIYKFSFHGSISYSDKNRV
jgi:hypothetical protein